MPGKMVRCAEGHFYDSEKHTSCPWCGPSGVAKEAAAPAPAADRTRKLGGNLAVAANPAAYAAPAPVSSPRPEAAPVATKRLDMTEQGARPVVGWIVCTDGPDRGRDYRIHAEKNFIGRDASMDVSLSHDESVSRDRHAILVFDPKKKNYWLYPGESQGLVYLKEELVNSPVQVGPYEEIEVGASTLVLVPFDTEKYPL
jgi:hypothetical protein